MIFNTEYFTTLDRGFYKSSSGTYVDSPVMKEPVTTLTAREIGSSEADIGGGTPLQKLDAAIRSGAAKMEFTFFGKGKSGGQQHTPESVGKLEREQMRELANINKMKFSIHATPNMGGASGLTREGFSEEARNETYREISKAIEFAADATTGGAVVFHTGEWQRPLSEIKDKSGASFMEYSTEKQRSPIMVADNRTGEVRGYRKDQTIFEPKFMTIADYEKQKGVKISGKTFDVKGDRFTAEADDWVDINGNPIRKKWLIDKDIERSQLLFERVPIFNAGKTDFEVQPVTYAQIEEEAKKLNVAPEVLFAKRQAANDVLRAKGQSLYHAKYYKEHAERRDAIKDALQFYEKLDESTPDSEKWKLMTQKGFIEGGLVPPRSVPIKDYLKEQLKRIEDDMRYTHESSASADAQARQALEQMNNFVTLEQFGISRTAETISDAGIQAMSYSKKNKDKLKEDIYIAPESFMPQMYGSHPEEIRKVIEESRKAMADKLVKKGYESDEAKQMAKNHIKATLDTGHFNLWRKYHQAKPGESAADAEKRFEKWYLDETEKLAKDGIIGHVHLTDNFGYDDEHVTPGQGNAPITEFMKRMEKAGIKDFIVERGSDNPDALWHFLGDMGSPIYSVGQRGMNVSHFRHGHFGYGAPANYIVGAYAPSNEFRLWSEVPLE